MKPLENIGSGKKETVVHPQTIEEKLEEAEKDYKEGRTHSEDEVWKMLSKKYRFDL